jgi:hypothetical protein
MDASNLALYNTLGVEDKDDNFLEKKILENIENIFDILYL